MKKFFLLFAVALLSLSAMAQKTTNQIILKNGSMIKGEIVEQVPGQNIKIKTADGSIFVYDMKDVEKITQVEKTSSSGNVLTESKHRGLDLSAYVGPEFSLEEGGGTTFAADIEVGKKFSKSFYFGIGSGVRAASHSTNIPVFGTFRFFMPLKSTSITPTISLRGGYAFSTENEDWSCPFIEVMPGVQIPVSPAIDVNIGVGYIGTFYESGTANGLGVKLGVGVHKLTGVQKKFRPTRDSGLQYEIGYGGGTSKEEIGHEGDTYKENVGGGDFNFAITYKMNPNISFGVGVGFGAEMQRYDESASYELNQGDYFKKDCYTMDFFSVFLRGKYRLTTKKLSPFVAADLGIMSPTSNDIHNYYFEEEEIDKQLGTMKFVTPSVGLSWRIAPNSYLEAKVGYRMVSAALSDIEITEESKYNGKLTKKLEAQGGTSNLTCGLTFVHTTKLLQDLFKK